MNQDEKTLYVKLAYQYYQNKEYKRAYELYAKLAEADPEDFNIFNMLGDVYLKADLKSKAADAYADTMSILERKGHNNKIIKLAKKVVKNIPDDQRIKTKLKTALRNTMRDAERKIMNHEYAEAREMLESMMDFSGDELPVKARLAELETEENKHTSRERQLAERKDESRSNAGSQNELIDKFDRMAQNYINNNDFDGAVETYITALKLAPGNNDLREKLHRVYVTIAQKTAGERVWDKIDAKPHDKLEDAKRKAADERRTQILKEEEERARRLMDEEERIQQEYELMEAEIIHKAAQELKVKLDEAQKEKLKEEEIQRIMKEQEEKKKELLEQIKREAIEKWKKQKEAIQGAADASLPAFVLKPAPQLEPVETLKNSIEALPDERIPKSEVNKQSLPPEQQKHGIRIELPPMPIPDSPPKPRPKPASLMDTLKKTYETPVFGQGKELPETQRGSPTVFPKVVIKGPSDFAKASASAEASADKPSDKPPAKTEEKTDDGIVDDIGEVEKKVMKDEVVVNGDTLDSLITTAYIYINQRMFKEALHIHNKITEKYPDNEEAKQLVIEITKRQG